MRPELARARLLYGEWLRREGRRVEAREQLRIAHDALTAMGMDAFAERARRELAATGETVRKRTVDTSQELTAQELHIARLATQGLHQPRDRRRALHQPPHRGVAPAQGVRETRDHRTQAPARRPANDHHRLTPAPLEVTSALPRAGAGSRRQGTGQGSARARPDRSPTLEHKNQHPANGTTMTRHIEDYALIGDLRTAALVGVDGAIDWLSLPRFDSPAVYAALLGDTEHGQWTLAPVHQTRRSRRRYRTGTLVLETDWTTADGAVRVTDLMVPGSSTPMVVRIVDGLVGTVAMQTHIAPRMSYGKDIPTLRRSADGRLARDGRW